MNYSKLDILKFIVVSIVAGAIILFAVWFIPQFIRETTGLYQCKAVGDVTVCWSIK